MTQVKYHFENIISSLLKGMLATLFGGETPVNFATWMGFAVPIMLVNLALTWLWLQLYFMGVPWGKNKVSVWSIGPLG